MMYIAIAFTLLALIGGVFLLSKVKTDAMGSFAKWMAYLVIVVSLGMLGCELGRSVMQMTYCGGDGKCGSHGMGGMQYCPPEMCGGKACYIPAGGGCSMMGGGGCAMMGGSKMGGSKMHGSKMHGDKMHGDMKCCDEDMEKGEESGMKEDSAATK